MDMNPDKMRTRFHELSAKAVVIREKVDPLRDARDKLAAKHAKEIDAANAKVRKAEHGLADIDNERAMLVRALGGRMGEPDAAE